MSFIDIKDPKKRDEIVADYLSIIRRVQQRNEDERAVGLAKQVELEHAFSPVIKSTEKATRAITSELIPLREEIKKIKSTAASASAPAPVSRKRTWDERSGRTAIDYYLNDYGKKKLDKYYGIQEDGDDGELVMGEKKITVDGNSNINVDDVSYKGTPGLWSLIMLATPRDYTDEDFESYRDLVMRTNVAEHLRGVQKGTSRPTQTFKRKTILENIMRNDEEEEEEEEEASGSGIQFLPGDIKGLSTKLNLLLAEFRAGNTSTRNEIVSILDELSRRKRISRQEYTDINTFLATSLR